MSTTNDGGRPTMSETASKMPARIWATCNGMSTRLPDGHRQFIGGWSEDKGRPRAEAFIRADIVERLAEALARSVIAIDDWLHQYAPDECAPKRVTETRDRIMSGGGTLAYIAGIQQQNRSALTSYREASNVEA